MAIDTPIVVYDDKKKKEPTRKKMDEMAEKWAKRKKSEGSLVGKEVKLSDILK